MEKLIIDIQDRLRAQVSDLRTIDENYGQLQKMFEESEEADIYPVLSPAVFIDTPDTQWSNLGGASQTGRTTIVITLAIDCYDDTHVEQNQRQKIVSRLSLAQRVVWALQGWKPTQTTRLIRTQTRLFHLPHLWKAYEITFTTQSTDIDPAAHALSLALPTPPTD